MQERMLSRRTARMDVGHVAIEAAVLARTTLLMLDSLAYLRPQKFPLLLSPLSSNPIIYSLRLVALLVCHELCPDHYVKHASGPLPVPAMLACGSSSCNSFTRLRTH